MTNNFLSVFLALADDIQNSLSPGLLAVIGMAVVFAGLAVLQVLVNIFHSLLLRIEKNEERKKLSTKDSELNVTKEEAVAIALALNLYQKKFMAEHDYIITLKKYTKNVTPWKIGNRSGFPNSNTRFWR